MIYSPSWQVEILIYTRNTYSNPDFPDDIWRNIRDNMYVSDDCSSGHLLPQNFVSKLWCYVCSEWLVLKRESWNEMDERLIQNKGG